MSKTGLRRIAATLVFMLLLVPLLAIACGGGDGEDAGATATETAAETETESGAETMTESVAETETESGVEAMAETETESGAEAMTESDTETMSESVEKGKIVLVEQDWDGNLVTTAVAQLLLEQELGYDVELKFAPADSAPLFIGLSTGDFHFVCCNWPSYSRHLLEEYVDSDNPTVERLGPSGVLGVGVGWYVPTYVIEGDEARGIEPLAPDLVSYEQLNQYKDVFSTADTGGKGRILEMVPAWDMRMTERAEALELDYEIMASGSEAATLSELAGAYQRGDPIIIMLWEPHWGHAKWDLTHIELPPWTEQCYPNGTSFECGWPTDIVAKLAWPGLKDQFPDAYQFLKNLTIDNDEQAKMVLDVGDEGMTPLEAAQEWIDANEDVWGPWIP
jgi:glycine betaine/proline transport system substrate-binding protein